MPTLTIAPIAGSRVMPMMTSCRPERCSCTRKPSIFAWGAFAGIERHPYGRLFRAVVRPRLGPPAELEEAAPPTFAQGVGFAITLVGVVLGALGLTPGLVVAAALAFVAAFLNSVFGYCLGCQAYVLLLRARIIRPA